MELADVTDSKSVGGDIVWVRVPPPAPEKSTNLVSRLVLFSMKRSGRSTKSLSLMKLPSAMKCYFGTFWGKHCIIENLDK